MNLFNVFNENRKHFLIIFSIITLILIILQGCSKNNDELYAKKLLKADKSSIDNISITSETGNREITDEDSITNFISKLNHIKIKKCQKKKREIVKTQDY